MMHFRDDASAAQRAADASGLVPHALVRLMRPEDRLATLATMRQASSRVSGLPR
jgi:hypothetical protein